MIGDLTTATKLPGIASRDQEHEGSAATTVEPVATSTIESLPNEVLALITSFLDKPEQITLALTCKALLGCSRVFGEDRMCLLKYSLRQRERLLNLLDRDSRHTIDCLMCSYIHSAGDFHGIENGIRELPRQCDPWTRWEGEDEEGRHYLGYVEHQLNTMHLQVFMKWHRSGVSVDHRLEYIKAFRPVLRVSNCWPGRKFAYTHRIDIKMLQEDLYISNKFFMLWKPGESVWATNESCWRSFHVITKYHVCPHDSLLPDSDARHDIAHPFREAFNVALGGGQSCGDDIQCRSCETECMVSSQALPEHGFFAVVITFLSFSDS